MNTIIKAIASIYWQPVTAAMHAKSFALPPDFLPKTECDKLIED